MYVATAGAGGPDLMIETERVSTIEEVTPDRALALIHQSIQEASPGEGHTLVLTQDHLKEVDIPLLLFEVQDIIETAQGIYVHGYACACVCTIEQFDFHSIRLECTCTCT